MDFEGSNWPQRSWSTESAIFRPAWGKMARNFLANRSRYHRPNALSIDRRIFLLWSKNGQTSLWTTYSPDWTFYARNFTTSSGGAVKISVFPGAFFKKARNSFSREDFCFTHRDDCLDLRTFCLRIRFQSITQPWGLLGPFERRADVDNHALTKLNPGHSEADRKGKPLKPRTICLQTKGRGWLWEKTKTAANQ